MRILTPALLFLLQNQYFSGLAQLQVPAAQSPAAPPPTIMTSQRVCMNEFAIRSARFWIRGYTMCEGFGDFRHLSPIQGYHPIATMSTEVKKTEVGSYFISNYPPFSQWTGDALPAITSAMASPPRKQRSASGEEVETPLGLYLHIPFCRKRCKFLLLQSFHRRQCGRNRTVCFGVDP